MKMKNKFIQFLCLLITVITVMIFSTQNVRADFFDINENKVLSYGVDHQSGVLSVEIQYQNGISDVEIYICSKDYLNSPGQCTSNDGYITKFVDTVPQFNSNDFGTQKYYKEFKTPTSGTALNSYDIRNDEKGNPLTTYTIMIKAKYCRMRAQSNTVCEQEQWDDSKYINPEANHFNITMGFTSEGELNSTLSKILGIVNNIVIPILWVILGVILIVRGIMLGIDIVKSADEPDVRKRKVSGLIWLFIGVFAGYAVTIAASAIMSMFGYGGIFK